MSPRRRLEEHAQANRGETRSLMVTAVHLASFIERGEMTHHSFHGRPHVVRHLCQISILMEAVVIEGWMDVVLDIWSVPVARKIQTVNGRKHTRSNLELASEILRVAKRQYMRSLSLTRTQRSGLIRVLNEALEAVRICFRIRNCIAHGDAAIVLTQGQRKRVHKRLTTLMQGMTAARLQELLEGTRRFTDCLEILLSDFYRGWRLDLRKRQLTQLSGVNVLT